MKSAVSQFLNYLRSVRNARHTHFEATRRISAISLHFLTPPEIETPAIATSRTS